MSLLEKITAPTVRTGSSAAILWNTTIATILAVHPMGMSEIVTPLCTHLHTSHTVRPAAHAIHVVWPHELTSWEGFHRGRRYSTPG